MVKSKVKNRDRVISNLTDPTGWTFTNNPHPNTYARQGDRSDWRNWHEWDKTSTYSIKCHSCILRVEVGSGNCRDGGDYFICLPKEVREGKVPYRKPIVTKQSKLI